MANNDSSNIDNYTPRLGLPLPNAANLLSGDVSRLEAALQKLDRAATVGADGVVVDGQLPEVLARIDQTTRHLPRGYYGPEVVLADSDTGVVTTPSDYGLASTEELQHLSDVLQQVLSNTGDPLSSTRWIPARALLSLPEWSGYVASDGVLLQRAAFPSLFALVDAGKVPTCTDQDWLADPTRRGCYTLGNGTTTFRIPDYNGVSEGSLGAAFLRGDGAKSAGVDGRIQDSQNKSHLHPFSGTTSTGGEHTHTYSQAYKGSKYYDWDGSDSDILFGTGTTSSSGSHSHTVSGDTGTTGGDESRPISVTGCHVIRAFGTPINTGEVDMRYVASEVERMRRYMEPVLKVEWMPLRAAPFDGFAPSDGQLLSRALYPDAWAAIQAGKVPVCTDQDWLADPSKRGCYTAGNGVDTFRIPDYNGVSVGSYGPAYLGGGGEAGTILRDRLQNITGGSGIEVNTQTASSSGNAGSGAILLETSTTNMSYPTGNTTGKRLTFDASRVARTGDTTRPITATGCFGVRLYGSVQNQGRLDVEALTAEVEALKKGAAPVCSVEWQASRKSVRTGFAPADGQLLSRALYPDAWEAIASGRVPVCTDADWLADPSKRGCYTAGNGVDTFRIPDYNGVSAGSYGPVYLGGGTTDGGAILRDRLQNITGRVFGYTGNSYYSRSFSPNGVEGAFSVETSGTNNDAPAGQGTYTGGGALRLDASRVARTGDTTRPITAEGCLAVKLFGAVQNTGSADAAALATAVAALAARVTALEEYPRIVPISSLLTPTANVTLTESECSVVEYKTHYDLSGIARFPAVSGALFTPFAIKSAASKVAFTPGQFLSGADAFVANVGPLAAGAAIQFQSLSGGTVTAAWAMFNFKIIK